MFLNEFELWDGCPLPLRTKERCREVMFYCIKYISDMK